MKSLTQISRVQSLAAAALMASGVLLGAAPAYAQINTGTPQILSTGQTITPLVPNKSRFEPLNPNVASDPNYTVGQAVSTAVSPDKKTLLVLTSGYNLETFTEGKQAGQENPAASSEWIFVFKIGLNDPIQTQAIPVPDTYSGIAWNPNGTQFYVSGGDQDDVHIYSQTAGKWAESTTPVALGHLALANPAAANFGGIGLETYPEAAGIAVSSKGDTLVVANYENDTISILKVVSGAWTKTAEFDLRPGVQNTAYTGVPGGEFPFWVTFRGEDEVYVSSVRDRQVVVVSGIQSGPLAVIKRITVPGQPNKMVLNAAGTKLYVAQDNSQSVAVIDTASNTVSDEINVTAPVSVYPNKNGYLGQNSNSLALSPDEKKLYVTNAGENAVAVVSLSDVAGSSYVEGLIPTGFYPNSVSLSGDGGFLYVVNGKSANGPNPNNCEADVSTLPKIHVPDCNTQNQYDYQLTKAGFQSMPTPVGSELSSLTQQVAKNNNWLVQPSSEQLATMAALHLKIKHVIYIIKENRTYDQILGDLEVGNGDPALTEFPEANTPNFHSLARSFVTFDNFYDTSEVSGDGWPWSTSARTTDVIEKEIPVDYAGRGTDNDSEGTNRNLNIAYGNTLQRYENNPLDGDNPNVMPGNANVAAPDAAKEDDDDDAGQGQGYLWNAALKKGLTVRDYGFFCDISRYNLPAAFGALNIPELTDPAATKTQVAYSSNTVLRPYTDPYFRGFDQTFPDYYRFQEWDREFKQFEVNGKLPSLTLLRLPHDHFGNLSIALNGLNTPELQMADNDYAVGLVAETVAKSSYKNDTLIMVIEDDAQDGGDHVDAHRSNFYMMGPYVKQSVVDSTRYTTVSVLRTIEDILGIDHLNLNDANAQPMYTAFDLSQTKWDYTATPSEYLKASTLPIKFNSTTASNWKPLHDGAWWAAQTAGMDFRTEDHLDTAKFNHVLWEGTMGEKAYPNVRDGADLRIHRAELLKNYRAGHPTATSADNRAASTTGTGASE